METLVNVYFKINRFSDIRPYKCKFCDYYARTNSQLKVHMMRHQGKFVLFLTFSILFFILMEFIAEILKFGSFVEFVNERKKSSQMIHTVVKSLICSNFIKQLDLFKFQQLCLQVSESFSVSCVTIKV